MSGKTYVNPKIVISEPVKRKLLGYFIILDKKNPDKLTIKAKRYNGRGLGVVGNVGRDGTIFIKPKHYLKLNPMMDKIVHSKIELVLDLVYGTTRTNPVKFGNSAGDSGVVEFKKNLC